MVQKSCWVPSESAENKKNNPTCEPDLFVNNLFKQEISNSNRKVCLTNLLVSPV